MITDKTNERTDRISYLKLDPFCGRGRVKMAPQVLMVGLTRKNYSKDYYGDTKDRTGNRFYELGTGGSNKTDEFLEKSQRGRGHFQSKNLILQIFDL